MWGRRILQVADSENTGKHGCAKRIKMRVFGRIERHKRRREREGRQARRAALEELDMEVFVI